MPHRRRLNYYLSNKHARVSAAIFVSLMLVGFFLSGIIRKSESSQLLKLSQIYSKYLVEKISSAAALKLQVLNDFERYWRYQRQVTHGEWMQFAKYTVESNSSIRTAGWVDENNVLRWRFPNDPSFIKEVNKHISREIIERIKKEKTVVATSYKKLQSGFYGYGLAVPLFRAGTFKGYYYFTIDTYSFLKGIIENDRFAVSIFEDDTLMYKSDQKPGDATFAHNESFLLQGKKTRIHVEPTQDLIATLNLLDDKLALLLSFLIAVLVSVLYYFLREAHDRQKIITSQATLLANSSKLMALGEMASGIAHEINNPLAILSGKIHILRKELGVDVRESSLQHLDRMDQIIFRIAKIISSLKKLSYKANEFTFEEVTLESIFQEVLDVYNEKLKNAGVELKIDSIPEVMVQCNPIEVNQIISNLLTNAFDAVVNLPEKWIRISVNIVSDNIRIQVVDSGKGIPHNIQSKILQPFFTTKPVGMGMGIGLSISHSLAKHNHGDLYLDNKSQNTKFVLELKAATGDSELQIL